MRLLATAAGVLRRAGIPHCLVGAAAMAARGVSRATFDADLLVTDPAALNEALWSSLRWADSSVEICRGDVEDPLAGAVRVTSGDEPPVDVIVGRSQWQAEVIARAEPVLLAGAMIPVARTADLILLKLFAGGPQDAWDIHQLLSADTSPELVRAVEGGLQALPASARALWERIGSERA